MIIIIVARENMNPKPGKAGKGPGKGSGKGAADFFHTMLYQMLLPITLYYQVMHESQVKYIMMHPCEQRVFFEI